MTLVGSGKWWTVQRVKPQTSARLEELIIWWTRTHLYTPSVPSFIKMPFVAQKWSIGDGLSPAQSIWFDAKKILTKCRRSFEFEVAGRRSTCKYFDLLKLDVYARQQPDDKRTHTHTHHFRFRGFFDVGKSGVNIFANMRPNRISFEIE